MVAVVIPGEDDTDESMEIWYVDQIFALTKKKDQQKILPKNLPDEPPEDIAKLQSEFLQENQEYPNLKVQITGTPSTDPTNYQHTYAPKFFQPIVLNYVGRTTMARLKRATEKVNLEGYGVCLTNVDDSRQVQVVFDVVVLGEEILGGDDEGNSNRFAKDKHLTPLEESLEQSINAANSVLREMKYMEKREQRMRKTAESINARVRWFSYLSVSVLLAVTYIQVTYLKRYFHKKKLM